MAFSRLPWSSAALLIPVLGCQDYVFEQVCPETINEVAQSVAELRATPADILFVVDNSGSMREEQDNLANNFRSFIEALSGGTGSYRIAIVTTDFDDGNACRQPGQECGGFVEFEFDTEDPFYRVSRSVDACQALPVPVTCFRTDDDGRSVITNEDQTAEEIEQSFQQAVRVGTCGSGIERGLSTMASALDEAANGCNRGFLRAEANLVVVFVADERGNSIDDPSDGIQDEELQEFIDALIRAKGGNPGLPSDVDYPRDLERLSQVRAAAIVGSVDGQASECRTDETGADNDGPTAACGSLCDRVPSEGDPELGSGIDCSEPSDCTSDELCTALGAPDNQPRCVFRKWGPYLQGVAEGNPRACASCTNYNVEDCCLAEPGDEYVAFVQRVGALARDPTSTGRDACRSTEGQQTFCLIDSICEEKFDETLERIALELVAAETFTLEPPANNPDGVRVRILGADSVVRELEPGVDFRVSEDGTEFRFLGGSGPKEGESLNLFYTTEPEKGSEDRLRGACTSTTSTTT